MLIAKSVDVFRREILLHHLTCCNIDIPSFHILDPIEIIWLNEKFFISLQFLYASGLFDCRIISNCCRGRIPSVTCRFALRNNGGLPLHIDYSLTGLYYLIKYIFRTVYKGVFFNFHHYHISGISYSQNLISLFIDHFFHIYTVI